MLPWLTADESIIQVAKYYLHEDETTRDALPPSHPAWDPTVDVHFSVDVNVTPAGLMERCALRPDDQLRVVLSWHSHGTTLRGVDQRGASSVFTPRSAAHSQTLDTIVPGPGIADVVTPIVRLVLVNPAEGARSVVAAARPGSLLWSNQWDGDVRLLTDGVAGIFPVRLVDFASAGLPAQAGWSLRWDPDDFHVPVTTAMTLRVNTAHTSVYRAVQDMINAPGAAAIREAIVHDVVTQMVLNALESPDFTGGAIYEDGTIGMVCTQLLAALFGNRPLDALRSDRHHDPSLLRDEIQSHLRTFVGV